MLPEVDLQPGQQVDLPADLVKHLRTVLRLSAGDGILLLDGRGGSAPARILSLESGSALAEVLSVSRLRPSAVSLSLIQGVPKGDKLDLVLQKGTELGVGRFILTPMARSVGRIKAERKEAKSGRWKKIVLEAARQSGQAFLPEVEVVQDFSTALAQTQADLKLLLWEEAALPLPNLLPAQPPMQIAVVIGPEGGLTAQEAELAIAAGYRAVRLGPRILRTETAGLAIMSILQYLYGDLGLGQLGNEVAFQGKDES